MHFFTSIYGEKYLPFLRVFLRSLTDTQTDYQLTVAWDDVPELEIDVLAQHFPDVQFQRCDEGIENISNVHQRIPMKLRYWMKFLESVDDDVCVGFLDVDTMLMQELSDCLPSDADVVYTWKVERFPLNTGVILLRNSAPTRKFMEAWLTETNAIIADDARLQKACGTYGAADQLALANLLPHHDFTSNSEKDFGAGLVRICPAPCEVLNQTNSHPFSKQARLYHLKSGWHRILLEDGDYTPWRTQADCTDIQYYWMNCDTTTNIDSWREYCIRTVEKQMHHFPAEETDEYVVRGILNSEMLAVISMLHELDIDLVVESGRYLGQSTKVLAQAMQGSKCVIHSTELKRDEIAAQAEQRLAHFDNIQLHYGDAADVIPKIVAQHPDQRIAILLDGPKGRPAFELLNRAIAENANVIIGFIHDLRDSYPGMLNPNRVDVHEWFERIFFTDDEEYVTKFKHFDDACHIPGFWEPHYISWRRAGSYGPTLGVILPTARDRFRAQQRLNAQLQSPSTPPIPAHQPQTTNPLKKLHRIPGYSQGKAMLKKGLGLEHTTTSRPGNFQELSAGANGVAREMLATSIDVKESDIVIDCGANVGQEVAKFADSGAMIYAFEPNPHAFSELRQRFRDHVNVVCFPMAVLDRVDTVRLFMHELSEQDEVKWSTGSSILDCKGNVVTDRFVEVPTIDLSEFVFRLDKRVKLLKMDIEGAEYETLEKLISRGLADQIDHILVETHAEKIPVLQPQHQALQELIASKAITNIDLSWI